MVESPWWPEVDAIVDGLPSGAGVTVVRLLRAVPAPDHPMSGATTYLATAADVASLGLELAPWSDRSILRPHPLRMPWADPLTARAGVDWACEVIDPVGEPRQHKSWNLSSIWSLPTAERRAGGRAWLKSQPPFMAHEAVVMEALAGPTVPRPLATSDHGVLLPDLPGIDGHGAGVVDRCRIVGELVDLQVRSTGSVEELLATGVPDHRSSRLVGQLGALVARLAPDDGPLTDLVAGLDERLARVAACGLPDVVVHGDAHPGNARIGCDRPHLFDWADSFIGHPLFDLNRVIEPVTADDTAVREHWLGLWRRAVPASDPERALELMGPLVPLREAWLYQRFVDSIEPDEAICHRADVPDRLAAASSRRRPPPERLPAGRPSRTEATPVIG